MIIIGNQKVDRFSLRRRSNQSHEESLLRPVFVRLLRQEDGDNGEGNAFRVPSGLEMPVSGRIIARFPNKK